jgi:hypothetical protein
MKPKTRENDVPEVEQEVLYWNEDDLPKVNYAKLGKRLATCDDLYRCPEYAGGLLVVLNEGDHRKVTTGKALSAIIVDRVPVQVIKDGKLKGGRIPAAHLDTMLKAEIFLACFRPVDIVTGNPLFLLDFSLVRPGLNEGGDGYKIFYTGDSPTVSNSMETINKFLNVMPFETNADRTNAVAAALTVLLRNHWLGGKPILTVTANKSHSGKDTIIDFATNEAKSTSISHQTDWAFERAFVGALKTNPDTAVVVMENARSDGPERSIASAFLERFTTDPKPFLFSTGTGYPVRRRNDIVTAISTNCGMVSEDIANRSLRSHLNLVGNVADRPSPIGNPRQEFLPANKHRIAAELRGMICRWKEAGMPLDETVRHPFTLWAKTVGGILSVNGFTDFLGNYGQRKTSDDPLRHGLAILGAASPTVWLQPEAWVRLAVQLGVDKAVIPVADRGSEAGNARGIGVVLSAHRNETFDAETETHKLHLKLEKQRRRSDGGSAHVQYRFRVLSSKEIPTDDEADENLAKPTTSKPRTKKSRKVGIELGQPMQEVLA